MAVCDLTFTLDTKALQEAVFEMRTAIADMNAAIEKWGAIIDRCQVISSDVVSAEPQTR